MWNLFSSKAKPLSRREWNQQALKSIRHILAMAGPRYKVVSGTDEYDREQGAVEFQNEDFYLSKFRRGRMLDLCRNQMRNSPTFNGILKQFDFNAIGTKGGKATFMFEAPALLEQFKAYTRSCDFFDGLSLNTLLKVILRTYITGGDMVLLFDDGLVEDSGKVLIYEPDEIGNTTDAALHQHYGKYAQQSQGRVYSRNGRWIGAIVSRSQRGAEVFSPDSCYFLKREPDGNPLSSKWMMPRNVFRISQGRGVSPMASSLANTIDLEDLCGYELQSAKKNSQILAQVLQTASPNVVEEQVPSAFDTSTDFESMTDEELEQAVQTESQSLQQTMSLDKIAGTGTIYQVLPENYKMELLDTKRPNPNIPDFIRFLASRSAAPFGMSQSFATMSPTGGDFRAEQLMSWPAFKETQHFLEGITDWILYRFAIWSAKKGNIDYSSLPEKWLSRVKWQWPTMNEVDEVAHQNALEKKFANGMASFAEEWGAEWQEKLQQIAYEKKFMEQNGMLHPSDKLKSGGQAHIEE